VDRAEKIALVIAGVLMTLFFGALVYSTAGLDISLPTCVTDVAPFKKGQVIDKGDNHYEVHMVARMWAFDPPEVRLPPGADVDLYLSALDVTHGMYIEHTDVNLMAVPGAVNAARVHFDREGEYPVICHEYCGLGHQNMMGKFVIARGAAVPTPTATPAGGAAPSSASALGAKLFESKGCSACHTVDGSEGVGPTMKGLYGHEIQMEDGSSELADETHLEDEIRAPNKHVVKGFQPLMPELPLTDEEVKALVAYIKTLS
jgi:cytochrome c oxidase subunit II